MVEIREESSTRNGEDDRPSTSASSSSSSGPTNANNGMMSLSVSFFQTSVGNAPIPSALLFV